MAHDHHSHQKSENYNRAFIVGLLLNITFVVIEFGYGLKISSLALIADAAHNLGDVFGLLLSWAGLLAAQKAASNRFSYGWKKASIVAAFVNSVVLLIAMGTLAWEAILRFKQPVQMESVTVMIVATVGIVVNSLTAFMFMSGRKNDINLQGAFLHMMADALISLGVVIAGALTLYFELTIIDPITSLIIVLVIVAGTLRLLQKSVHMLFDGVPENISFEEVKSYLLSQPGVVGVQDLRIWNLSSTEVALTAHLVLSRWTTDEHFVKAIKKHLHDRFAIEHVTIQLNTDT